MAVAVRRAVVDDAAEMARVHVATWRHAYAQLLPEDVLRAQSVADRADAWRQHLRDPAVDVRVAGVAGGACQGFVAFGPSRDGDASSSTGEVYALYVHPDSWDTGVGRTLLAVAEQALAVDVEQATLWVLVGNRRARGFYERAGWAPDGAARQETWDGTVLDEVRYRGQLRATR